MKRKILALLFFQVSAVATASEYQKMFSCSQALKNEAQISNKLVAKNFTVLPVKNKGVEGVNLFLQDKMYFCKLPKKFKVKNVDERVYKMTLNVPERKSIYISYVKSNFEPPHLEILEWDENMDFSSKKMKSKKTNLNSCIRANDPHGEKVLANFLRKEISQIHDKAGSFEFSSYARSTMATLKLCERSFLLKSVSDNEIRKFEARTPAARKEGLDEPILNDPDLKSQELFK